MTGELTFTIIKLQLLADTYKLLHKYHTPNICLSKLEC